MRPSTDESHFTEFYRRHLASDYWRLFRARIFRRALWQCENILSPELGKCTRTAEQVHHLNYHSFGHEREEDCIAVCKQCHDWLEAKKRVERRKKAVATFAERKYGHDWFDRYDEYEMEEDFNDWLEKKG